MRCLVLACVLFLAACQTGDDWPAPDGGVVALPPHEMVPDQCLGDCPNGVGTDAAVDAPIDAEVDAGLATHPPFPMPSPCDTCVGFSCETACADAGVDAP